MCNGGQCGSWLLLLNWNESLEKSSPSPCEIFRGVNRLLFLLRGALLGSLLLLGRQLHGQGGHLLDPGVLLHLGQGEALLGVLP